MAKPFKSIQDQLDSEIDPETKLAIDLAEALAASEQQAKHARSRELVEPSAPVAPAHAPRYDFDRERKEYREIGDRFANLDNSQEEFPVMDLGNARKLVEGQEKQRVLFERARKDRKEAFVNYVKQLHGEVTIIMSKESRIAIPDRIAQLDSIFIRLSDKLKASQEECANCKAKAASLGNEQAVSHFVNDELEKAKAAFEESLILERIIPQIVQSTFNLQERLRRYQERLRIERLEALKKKRLELDAKLDAEFAELGLEKTYIATYKIKETGQDVYMCPEDYNKTYRGQLAMYFEYFKEQSNTAIEKIKSLGPKVRKLGPKVQALVPYVKPENLKKVATVVFNKKNIVSFFTCGKRVPVERRLAGPGYGDAPRPLMYEPLRILPQEQGQPEPMYPPLSAEPRLSLEPYQPSVYPELQLFTMSQWERFQQLDAEDDQDASADNSGLKNRAHGQSGQKRI